MLYKNAGYKVSNSLNAENRYEVLSNIIDLALEIKS